MYYVYGSKAILQVTSEYLHTFNSHPKIKEAIKRLKGFSFKTYTLKKIISLCTHTNVCFENFHIKIIYNFYIPMLLFSFSFLLNLIY